MGSGEFNSQNEKTQVVCTGSISHAGFGSFGCHNLIKYVMDRLGHAINTFSLEFGLCYSVNDSMSFSNKTRLFFDSIVFHVIIYQSGIVISFDNHVTSQHGSHIQNREFSYSLRFARYLFDYTGAIYP